MASVVLESVRKRLRPLKCAVRNACAVYPHLTSMDTDKLKLVTRNLNGQFPRECTICGHVGLFEAYGSPLRWDARCPGCGALERHRTFALALQNGLAPAAGADVLHFAPEPSVRSLLEPMSGRYVTADLMKPNVDLRLDIQNLDLDDGCFDVIMCSHILEHVDDRRALAELFRVLRPGGMLYVMVPIVEGWDETYENPHVDSDDGRELHFGQFDHIRYYGRDLRTRLKGAGFELEEYTPDGRACVKHGLVRGETVFVCRKPAAA